MSCEQTQQTGKFVKRALSGSNGVPSSKRLFGAIILIVCMGCMIYLVIKEGGTQMVENIMQTFIIVGCTLLGLGSVTNTASALLGNKGHNTNNSQSCSDE